MFYGDPPGAILSIAGHKGYGLGIITEMLAGALTGGGASNPANASRLANGMLSIYLEPAFFQDDAAFAAEVERFIDWVKSSEKAQPDGEILMPGEIEEKTKAQRLRDGIELDDITWKSIVDTCRLVGVDGGKNLECRPRRAGTLAARTTGMPSRTRPRFAHHAHLSHHA